MCISNLAEHNTKSKKESGEHYDGILWNNRKYALYSTKSDLIVLLVA